MRHQTVGDGSGVYKLGPLVERMRNFAGIFGNGSFFCFKKLAFRDENQKNLLLS